MTTTSTEGEYTRIAELQDQLRTDDAARSVIVTLYRDGLPVIGMDYPAEPDEGYGGRNSAQRTWTERLGSNEQAALDALPVEDMLTARATADALENHTEDRGVFTEDGLAATWLAEDFA